MPDATSLAAPRPARAQPQDCRCLCGSLLARLRNGGVELKCRRCKRTTWLPLTAPRQEGEAPRSAAVARAGKR